MIRHSMAVMHAGVHSETGRAYGRNWFPLVLVGLCLEFWTVVLIFLAAYL